MPVRQPAVAGHFYPSSPSECRSEVELYLDQVRRPDAARAAGSEGGPLGESEELVGGIVPHAGWICSGAVAAEVLYELTRRKVADTFVIFGAAHRLISNRAALYGRGAWATPLGEMPVDEELAGAVVRACPDVEEDEPPHRVEHSIEVQVPLIQYLTPSARLLPILVPHLADGPTIGRIVAEQAGLLGRSTLFVGSTDLTHYGPRYGFTPKGVGPAGLQWAREVNDRRFLELVREMEADKISPHARRHQSACGSGAVAATVAACRNCGATRGLVLRHTTSNEVLSVRYGEMEDAVGYAGIVFAREASQ